MKLSQRGLDLIMSFEGYHTAQPDGSCKAYLDRLASPHIWTIGYGCTEGVNPGMVLTRGEAQAMFVRELEKHERIVLRLVTAKIGQNNFDALVSFSYNTGGLGKSTLLKKLNRSDFDGAAKEFAKWNKAGGQVYKGLVRRRAAEAAMFQMDASDNIPAGEPDMPQGVDAPPAMGAVAQAATGTAAVSTAGVGLTFGFDAINQASQVKALMAGLDLKMAAISAVVFMLFSVGLPWLYARVKS